MFTLKPLNDKLWLNKSYLFGVISKMQMFMKYLFPGEAKEVRIPVPYGHIAGKAWGDPSGKPILGLHGWLDNAGTHDHIAPLLSDEYYLVSLDQPGHGLSSKYPPGNQRL